MTVDLAGLLPSWELHLRAELRSPETVKSYGDGVRRFLAWADGEGRPAVLDRASVNAFTADLLAGGAEPATARARQLALRRFSAWLLEEGESDADHLLGLKSPKLDAKVVEPLTPEQIKALVAACAGRELRDRRDEALLRLMIETGARAGEVVALGTGDVDLSTGTATVRRGKGGRGRVVPFGPQTSRVLDRYLRARRSHRLAGTPALWLGDRGKAFSYDALHKTLGERARAAGIEGFRPHRLRHTAAHRWLAAGGSEGGLMAVGLDAAGHAAALHARSGVGPCRCRGPRAGARRLLTAVGSGHPLKGRLPARRRPHQEIGVVPPRGSSPQPAGLRQAGRWRRYGCGRRARLAGHRPRHRPPSR